MEMFIERQFEQMLLEGNQIKAISLTADAFLPYGQVIEASPSGSISANQGTAKRRNWLANAQNLRPDTAELNICVFHVTPAATLPFPMRLLERHSFSTQMFIPMGADGLRGYLVVVCLNGADDRPDFDTLRCLIAKPNQAINYLPGTWHHPIIGLEVVTDFSCMVYEAKNHDDCEEFYFNEKCPGRFQQDRIFITTDGFSAAASSDFNK